MKARPPPRRTFGSLFPGATRHVADSGKPLVLRVGGSGVSGTPEDAPWTNEIVAFLEANNISVERSCLSGMCNVDMYRWQAAFLDGGFYGQTGPYFFEPRGAWVTGVRAVLFVTTGLGVAVPARFFIRHGIEGAPVAARHRGP